MWDGSGGVADTFDYNGNDDPTGEQVDAIANYRDALFFPAVDNETALLYSLRTGPNVQGAGADLIAPVWYETTTGSTGIWATWPQVDQHGGENLDGLEIWGREGTDDADKYSLFGDFRLGTSVFNLDGSTYISQLDLATAVNNFWLCLR